MVDIDTHRIIDMINSREYNEVVTWLKEFPNLEIVSRDGSITYSNSIKDAHPNAIQVSDRFHLLKNLTSYCKKFLTKHLKTKVQIKYTIKDDDDNSLVTKESHTLTLSEKIREATKLSEAGITNTKICKSLKMDIRTLKKYLAMSFEEQEKHFNLVSSQLIHNENVSKKEQLISEVQKMHKKGSSNRAISKELKISRVTVASYLDKNVSAINGNYGITESNTLLSPYHETINSLLLEGYTFKKIEDFIREQGYEGSPSTIRMYTTRMRKLNKEAIIITEDKNVEFVERSLLIKLLYKPLEKVKRLSQEKLDTILTEYPLVDKIYQVILEFRSLFKSREASDLYTWIEKAKQLNIREINSFINGINRDIDAVKNSITYTYSNGLAEGSVNKIKVIKRIMYGRCNFSTLRLKILLLERNH